MLRRVENVSASHFSLIGRARIRLQIGKRRTVVGSRKLTRAEFDEELRSSESRPWGFPVKRGEQYWLFQGKWYKDTDDLDADQVFALLVTREQRQVGRVNRAQAIVSMAQAPAPAMRQVLPEDVRHFVWQRDRGQCQNCGSNTELQFDHIIPVAFGGSSEPQNLQLLCGPCNRRKGAGLA